MAHIITLPSHGDHRGSLTVIDKILPFEIRRVYYIYDVPEGEHRGGHKHKWNHQALVSVRGSVVISVRERGELVDYILDSPSKCLLLDAEDWHTMHRFSSGSVLLVLASQHFDPEDYFEEEEK